MVARQNRDLARYEHAHFEAVVVIPEGPKVAG